MSDVWLKLFFTIVPSRFRLHHPIAVILVSGKSKSKTMNTDGVANNSNSEPNYPDERGSAAAVGPVPAQTVADPPGDGDAPMDQDEKRAITVAVKAAPVLPVAKAAPSKAAPAAVPEGKKLKRGAEAALSPGHLSKTTGTPKDQRRPQHVITGVDQDFRLKVKEAIVP